MKLSDRVRPGSEAAPWVIEEIKRLEAAMEAKAAPVVDPDCDLSACGDFSPGPCDNPDCPALRSNKAEPVGEREAFREYATRKFPLADRKDSLGAYSREHRKTADEAFQAGAAYQRQSGVANGAEGSAAQKSFWAGFEAASLRLFGTNIRAAWNHYRASDEFAKLNKGAGSHE